MYLIAAVLESRFARLAWLVSLWCFLPAVSATAALAQTLNLSTTAYATTGAGVPRRIVVGPDGALWFTEGSAFQGGGIGRITTGGAVSNPYNAPISYTQPSSPFALTIGPDSAVWFTDLSAVGRVAPGGTTTSYPTAISGNFITTGSDGALWFTGTSVVGTEAGVIGRITTSGSLVTIPLPGPSFPQGITLGPDGEMWFLDPLKGSVGQITTAGNISEYLVPNLNVAPSFVQTNGGEIVTGSDGALWFADGNLSIGRITTGGAVTEYPVGVQPDGLTKGPDGAIWFTSANSDQIGQITTSGLVALFNLPAGTRGAGIALGPDGALWMCARNSATIVRIEVPTANGVFAHIAAGGSWSTLISLVNATTSAISVSAEFHGDDGSPLTLPLTVTAQGSSQTMTSSSVNAILKPKATLQISMGAQMASLVTGWARVASSGPIGGFAIFRTSSSNSPVSEGTVPLQNQVTSVITIPYDNTGGFATGVALANLSTSVANVTATSWDSSGNQLGTQDFAVPASGHTSFVVANQFPETAAAGGVLVFQTSGGIAGLGLRFSPFGTFTSVPTIY